MICLKHIFYLSVALPNKGVASSWGISMEQCKKSRKSTYLLGDIDLTNPHLICSSKPKNLQVFWVGVARQVYTSIDQGIYEYIIGYLTHSAEFVTFSLQRINPESTLL